MRKFTILTVFFAIIISLNGFGQLKDFDLSKYKLPNLERRTLETDFSVYGTNRYNESPSNINYNSYGNSHYSGNINLDYNYYLNNKEYQRETSTGIDFSTFIYNTKIEKELNNERSNIKPSIYYIRNNRKYFNNNLFLETNVNFNYSYNKEHRFSNRDNNSPLPEKEDLETHRISTYFPIKVGKGRIEPIQDARHAIYIFEELSKINRMSSEKTEEEIIEFSRFISELKNKRFFDTRLQRMAELESIDSFFVKKNYISKSDVKYFSTLSDFWAFGNRPFRYSGTRFSGKITPGYYYYNLNAPVENINFARGNYSLYSLILDGGFEFNYEKPINLKWQNSINLSGNAGIIYGNINDKNTSTENKIKIPNLQLGYSHTLGFYPNTRTDINFTYSAQYVQMFDKTDIDNDIIGIEGKGVKLATNLSVNYYISPKFRLSLNSSLYYIWQDSEDEVIIDFNNIAASDYILTNFTPDLPVSFYTKNFYNDFRIKLIYSIF